ncbi:glycosyltransferase involved in cell wall biosynthesis [Pseudochelatococcus lubricantis]|uniref:Glycosyltransferase involved in cell wall biosynthesis n=1 Tax=Pseudochelatococcus lubricantis TaxID=1538102 RepID=A0ABX0UZD1_9HYPH|nr:glycosyltransferase family 4 protein [Pseudochelatococcus lubricantis]NIJ57219.1 glycosyltransferase involved in cell wall biosynthesis [Pseudochelatococcus lubricantis]
MALKIAFVAHGVWPFLKAGSETMMHGLARSLHDGGHNVVTLGVRDTPGSVVLDGVTVLSGGEARRRWRLGRFDVVITHHSESLRVIPAARSRGIKSTLLVHSDEDHISRQIEASPDLVVYNTKWVREAFGVPGMVVHPPVRPEDHATTPGDAVTLVNLNRDKGAEVFYELARRLPDVQFIGVRGGHGAQITRPGPNVTILDGTADMKRNVWSRTSILLMPSLHESYGLAGMEAMASGIPVIANPTAGLCEALGDAGVFIDREDVDGYEAQLRLLLANPDRMKLARDAAKARVGRLSTGHELAAFVDAIERLAAGEKQAAAA